MKALLAAIEEECSPQVWARARQVSRSGQLSGRKTHNDELELRITTRGGMRSPLVVLSPAHEDWSCECPSQEPVCLHVAAAALAAAKAIEEGRGIEGAAGPTLKLAYRLERRGGRLHVGRFVAHGETLRPLSTRLTTARRDDRSEAVSPRQSDLELELALGGATSGCVPRPAMLRALRALSECTDVRLDGKAVQISDARPVMRVSVTDTPEGFLLKAEQDPTITEIFDNGAVLRGSEVAAVTDSDLSCDDIERLRNGRLYDYGQVADLVGRVLPALQERIPVQVESTLLPKAKPMKPRIVLKTEFEDGALSVLPTLVYGDPPAARVDAGKLHYLGGALPLRDEIQEQRLARSLQRDLELEPGKSVRLSGHEAVMFGERLRKWSRGELTGAGLDSCRLAPALVAKLEPDPAVKLQDGIGFGLQFVSDEDGIERHANPEAVVRAWEAGEPLVALRDGGWAPLPERWLTAHAHLVADLLAARDPQGHLPKAALADYARLCEVLEAPPPPDFASLRPLASGFKQLPQATLPPDLRAQLRDYQRVGVNWLRFLRAAGLGALLADDMGLGKTLQTLCALEPRALVVCPASVLPNWAAEAERFRPALRVHIYHGTQRALDPDADLTLTTYALLRLDAERLQAEPWQTVVLDEAQYIKNPESQVAQAAYDLPARFRVALTGTPVENRLDELWSQFHFTNRGLLGVRRHFQDRYSRPILDGDQGAEQRLQARIRPLLMRRLKREVAKELPPRTDVVRRCSLTERERDLYHAIYAASRTEVLERLEAGGNVMAVLEALLRLRQAACHTALLPGQHAQTSSKLVLLMETLDAALAEGHKALVFSQWTSLLDLVEPHLEQAGVTYCRLDGSTRDRGAVVAHFQDMAGPPVLLASLKAGGTGLNLTAAEDVFLLDPWWNPAVEDQAADRAHRIGQNKPVLVHRLIAEDTVEERMLKLQESKRALASAATGGGQAATGLTKNDLLELLA